MTSLTDEGSKASLYLIKLETEIKRKRAYHFYNNVKENQEFKEKERQRKK
jgi:hypothetical protein